MRSAGNGSMAVVEYLLRKGASLNLKDLQGNSALLLACMKGDLVISKSLLLAGADDNEVNDVR